jgi:cytochrome c biogenesis protein CcmG/thiol:disulfide interchange protein DsbE
MGTTEANGWRQAYKARWAILGWVLVALLIGAIPTPARAEEPAQLIFELAQKLFKENASVQSYTYWVGGNIGMPEDARRPKGLVPGKPLPEFSFREFDGTAKVTNADLKPPYILNFWASWCGPCRDEFPMFIEAMRDGSLSVPMYFINTGESSKSDAQFFLLQYAEDVVVYSDARSRYSKAVGIDFIPVTLLVDAEGNIQALQPGIMTPTGLDFFAAIAANPGVGAFDWKTPTKMPAPKQ